MVRIAGRDIEVYQPSEKTRTNVGGVLGMVLGGAVAAVIAGFLVYLILRWTGFYVQIVSPLVIGFTASVGLLVGSLIGNVREKRTWALVAAGTASLGYLSLLFFISNGLDASNPIGMLVVMAGVPENTFLGFSVPLWAWWAFESGIAVAFSILMTLSVREVVLEVLVGENLSPSCHNCGRAFKTRLLFVIPGARAEDALQAIADDDYQRIKDLEVDTRDGELKVVIDYCSDLSHPAYLTITDKILSNNPDLVRLAVMSNEGAVILLDDTSSGTQESSLASDGTGQTTVVDSTVQAEQVSMGTQGAQKAQEAQGAPLADEAFVPDVSPPIPEITGVPQRAGLVIEVFRPTDQTTLLRVLTMLIGGVVAGSAASLLVYFISGWTGFYIPVVFGALIGFAVFIGVGMGEIGGRVERKGVYWAVAVAAGCLSYLALQFLMGRAADPGDPVGGLISEAASWQRLFLGLSIPSLVVWLLDATVLVLVAGYFSTSTLGDPYCLKCEALCKSRPLFATSNELSGNVMNALGDRDYQALKHLEVERPPVRDRLNAQIYYCNDSDHDGYLTLTSVRPKGNSETDEKELVRYAVVKDGGGAILRRDFPRMD